MSTRSLCAAAATALLLAGCVQRRPEPAPAPPPPPAPPASLPTPPPTPPAPWEDGQATPGDWTYSHESDVSRATFGASAPLFLVECTADQRIRLSRAGIAMFAHSMRTLTTSGVRALPVEIGQSGVAATLAARDPLLDDLAFSRGRFAVEAVGTTSLILPAWPEVARVIEDCRG